MVEEEKQVSPWETETGLADDFDGVITNPRFGVKEEYAQQVIESSGGGATGLMFIADMVDDNGEIVASQGWSVGGGWEPTTDGLSISHPKRQNVVTASLYGQLQNCVIKELGVDMSQFGLPTEAMSWDKLKFHWMQKPHATVGGKEATGLMPTEFIGRVVEAGVEGAQEAATPVPATKPVVKVAATPASKLIAKRAAVTKTASAAEKAALDLVAQCADAKEFQKKAVKIAAIVGDDLLMGQCLDDGPTGFFAKNKK